MNSSRPYLLRALYEWIVDNGCTPHIIVDATLPGVDVPEQYVKDGQIVLNLSPSAVIELQLGDDNVSF
ncbi:MAG: ClpXP protease specificity-enhancing factor SspB, partial [Halieaceae bacterium]|nr:ClpXP protease specificity-enhancing factor SspB [Halieaceae bacterium]